jgi:GT2 family glycosyltransferase
MSPAPRVSVIVVSFEVRDLLRRCLTSIGAQDGLETETWVVDNASTDGSADMVAREFPQAHLIRNSANVGFARANNQALPRASGEILLLLNPDTELPGKALTTLSGAFQRHPEAGAVGLALEDSDGRAQPPSYAFPGLWNLAIETIGLGAVAIRLGVGTPAGAPAPSGGEGAVDWVNGACMGISRAAYERVGGLDESRFMYGEEMDWSWRARGMGFTTVFCGKVPVLHHVAASGIGREGTLFVHNIDARIGFLRRYRGAWRAAIAREILTAGAAARLAVWTLRALLEGSRRARRTQDQVERFRSVLAWRLRGAR